jgi:proteasome accessory factor B
MAKREYTQRQLLIIKQLRKKASSFGEIKKYLLQQQDITEDNFDISQRTFQRDLKDINTIYGIEIKFNKKEGLYRITEEEEDKPFERIMEAFETLTALNFSNNMSDKIILERKANKGTNFMHSILHSIQNHLEVTFIHQSFWKEEPEKRTVKPIAIKESQNRWYLVCFDVNKKEYRNFGLDRIKELEITNTKFEAIYHDINTMYQHAFGVETYEPAQKLVIAFTSYQAKYIKTLPLHPSQKILSEEAGFCRFEYFMHPTNDFIMEILKFGDNVIVEEPLSLREKTKERIAKMMALYK